MTGFEIEETGKDHGDHLHNKRGNTGAAAEGAAGSRLYQTQATISRDIKELRIVKELTSFGTYRYTTAAREVPSAFTGRLNTIFRECVTSFDYAQNIIVIHTLPGLANAAASALDAMNMNVVLGTLAGDDTVVVIMRDTNAAAAFCGEIKSLIGG